MLGNLESICKKVILKKSEKVYDKINSNFREKEINDMAIPTNIKTLLSGNVVEWARIEFKETWDAEASLKTVCAFANDLDNWGGGYIVIGVKELEGQPVYPLKGVPVDKVEIIDHIQLRKHWQKIIKNVFIISVRHPAQ